MSGICFLLSTTRFIELEAEEREREQEKKNKNWKYNETEHSHSDSNSLFRHYWQQLDWICLFIYLLNLYYYRIDGADLIHFVYGQDRGIRFRSDGDGESDGVKERAAEISEAYCGWRGLSYGNDRPSQGHALCFKRTEDEEEIAVAEVARNGVVSWRV